MVGVEILRLGDTVLMFSKAHLLSEKLATKSDSTLFATLAQVRVPVAECIPRTL
jgi:hypothetical protein